MGTHWVSFCFDRNTAVYFDSFLIEYIPQEPLKISKIHQLLTIYLEYKIRILLCVTFFCIVFIEYMLVEKTLLDYIIYFLRMTIKRMIK